MLPGGVFWAGWNPPIPIEPGTPFRGEGIGVITGNVTQRLKKLYFTPLLNTPLVVLQPSVHQISGNFLAAVQQWYSHSSCKNSVQDNVQYVVRSKFT
jgi:hypothetical protein